MATALRYRGPRARSRAVQSRRTIQFQGRKPLHHRDFFDKGGTRWLVSEWEAADVPGAHGERYLVFDSVNVCRRLWRYPADWYQLPSDELAALNEGDGFREQGR